MSDFEHIQALWKTQTVAVPEVDMAQLEKKSRRFSAQVKWRNIAEWVAAAFVVPSFLAMATRDTFPIITRVGAVLIAVGAVFVARRIFIDGRLRAMPDASQDTQAYVDAFRHNLTAQADLLDDVPRWYLGPFVPGMIAFFIGFIVAAPAKWVAVVASMVLCAVVFAAIGWMNRVAARRLRRRADDLTERR